MLPIPAIDMKDGQCVRLKQGRMEDATVFSDSPADMAGHWAEQGATRLHLVDLNGAFAGSPQNAQAVQEILARCPNVPVQIGGGIRDEETAKFYWDLGVAYVIIGSKAVSDPEFVQALARKYPKRIILGIDAKDGFVATDGWAKISDVSAVSLAQQFDPETIAAIIYTDISKDGMMGGVNVEQTAALAKATKIPVIASGGVGSLADITALKNADAPIYGTIVGRALYDGTFTLQEAYREAQTVEETEDTASQTYQDALALRREVFIDEQNVPADLELDDYENRTLHLVLYSAEHRPLATARIFFDGQTAKIQRVAVKKSARGSGAGVKIMQAAERAAKAKGSSKAVLGAQVHALGFYKKLGYRISSDEYMDAGIAHKDMEKAL